VYDIYIDETLKNSGAAWLLFHQSTCHKNGAEKLSAVWSTSNTAAATVFLLFFCLWRVASIFYTTTLALPQQRWQTDRPWLATKEPLHKIVAK
jgi:hypothetical protein